MAVDYADKIFSKAYLHILTKSDVDPDMILTKSDVDPDVILTKSDVDPDVILLKARVYNVPLTPPEV